VFKVDRLNVVVIAGASLGAVCSAGLVPVLGLLGWLTFLLFAICLAATIASQRRRTLDNRKLLAELQEHRAAFGSPSTTSISIASAACELVDTAERTVAESAAQVAELKAQLDLIRSSHPSASSDAGSSAFKNAFVTKVSHELRTPLAGIKAYVELLIDGEAEDEQTRQEFYQVIHGEADRLSRLVDDIVAISRIEAGVAKPQKKQVTLSSLLDNALAHVAADVRQKNVSILRAVSQGDYQTFGEPGMLEKALATLLINAIKFSPTGGVINVETVTNPQEKTVLTRILDRGPGVEPQDVPGLFDKFDGARACARTAGGAGVALALVRQIVEAVHGGAVFVESPPEGGCCFEIRLPLYAPQPSPVAPVGEMGIR
jgi:signal transduction histidine kinase